MCTRCVGDSVGANRDRMYSLSSFGSAKNGNAVVGVGGGLGEGCESGNEAKGDVDDLERMSKGRAYLSKSSASFSTLRFQCWLRIISLCSARLQSFQASSDSEATSDRAGESCPEDEGEVEGGDKGGGEGGGVSGS